MKTASYRFSLRRAPSAMYHKLAIGLLTLCSLFYALCGIALSATYYVDATNGNDNNSGLSKSTPWKTIKKVNKSSFKPGDYILFKRGEVWREQLNVPSSGTHGNPITFEPWGEGNGPEILGSVAKNDATDWNRERLNLWFTTLLSEPQIVWKNGTRMRRVHNKLDLDDDTQWWWDGLHLRVYVYGSSLDPTEGHHSFEIPQRDYAIRAIDKNYIVIRDLTVRFVNKTLIKVEKLMGTCRGWEIAYNKLLGGFSEGNIEAAGGGIAVVGEVYHDSDNAYVHHNFIQDVGGDPNGRQSLVTIQYGDSFKVNDNVLILSGLLCVNGRSYGILVRHSTFANTTSAILRNRISGDSGGGAIANGGNIVLGDVYYVRVAKNMLTAANIGTRGDETAPGTFNGPQFCIWEQNLIQPEHGSNAPYGFLLEASPNNIFRYNIVNMQNVSLINTFGRAIQVTHGSDNVQLYNNTVIAPGGASALQISWSGDTVYTKRTVAKNNIFYTKGHVLAGLVSVQKEDPQDPGNGHILDHNVYQARGNFLIGWMDEHYNSVGAGSDFTINTRLEENGKVADPLFVDMDRCDFHVLSTSPCIDAGTEIGFSGDYDGRALSGRKQDIGAYEFLSKVAPPCDLRIVDIR